jgi:hypothetical protein
MNLLKRFRPVLAVMEPMAFSAPCALGQAEVNPDHFNDVPQQAPVMQNRTENHANLFTVQHQLRSASPIQEQNQNAAIATKSAAHRRNGAGPGTVSVAPSRSYGTGQKQHKKLISEDHRHGM